MYNGGHIDALRKALELIKKGKAVFKEYCTEDCENCPLYKANVCGYDMEIDTEANITYGLLDDFVDYHEKVEDKRERQNFYAVTGVDPAWYDFNNDRTEGEK